MLVPRRKASLAWSAPVNPSVGVVGEHLVGLRAAAEPRQCVCPAKFASAPAPARIAASASRSASARSASHTAPMAPGRTDPGLARGRSRDSTWRGAPRLARRRDHQPRRVRWRPVRATAAAALVPHACGAPRHRADGPPVLPRRPRRDRAVIRPRVSASSTAGGSVILVNDARSIGSPTASTSITSRDRGGQRSDPRFDEVRQAGWHDWVTGPPPIGMLLREPTVGVSCSTILRRYNDVAAGKHPQPVRGIWVHGPAQRRRQQCRGLVTR